MHDKAFLDRFRGTKKREVLVSLFFLKFSI